MKPTREQYLLSCLAEECNEVAQRVHKALRFGLAEVQPGQRLTNAERVMREYYDLQAVLDMLVQESVLPLESLARAEELRREKTLKVDHFWGYSQEFFDGVATKPTGGQQ